MPFLILLLLVLACLQTRWPEPPACLGAAGSLWVVGVGWLVFALLAEWISRRGRRRLLADPERRWQTLRTFTRARRWHFFASLGFFVGALYLCGWGWVVREHWPLRQRPLPGLEIVLLAPFFTGLVRSWWSFWQVDEAIHQLTWTPRPFPGRLAYVILQARHNFLLVVPPLFLMLFHQFLFWLLPGLETHTHLLPVLGLGLLVAALISIPLILRLVLGLRSLPASPVRDHLESVARRLRFRCSDILVWDTRMTMANAMITGVLPWCRYVVVTDRLLSELSLEEMEGVFGHEVGHVKHHHMLFYLLFLFTSLLGFQALLEGLHSLAAPNAASVVSQGHVETVADGAAAAASWLEDIGPEVLITIAVVAALAVYFFVVFGYLSRRCERQADVFGARTAGTQPFIDALEKVAVLNGISRERPGWLSSWQHGTIAQRIAFLERMRSDPAIENRFRRGVALVKWSVVGSLAAIVLILGPMRVWEMLKHM